jgi:small-conductance mechanosensitive channel
MIILSLAELLRDLFSFNQLESEITAATIIFASSVAIGWATYIVFSRYFSRWAKNTKTQLDDDILRNIRAPVLVLAVLIGLFYALDSITFLDIYSEVIGTAFTVAQILVVTFIITRVINVLVRWFAQRAKRQERMSEHLLFILRQITKAVVYVFAFMAILAAFKIDLSGLVVGLGVGGIAIALALQNVLSDVFSAFSIYFDRPFEVGDFIVVGNYSGTVRKIGIKSTRLELLQGEELIMSNRELTTTSIRNFKKLKKRRVVFKLTVATDTPLEKLKKIPDLIKGVIEGVEQAEFERAHLMEFGDFSLNFEVVYYMKTPDYNRYMDTQQKIDFGILEVLDKESIAMPFPTQTILLQKEP